MAEIPNQEEEPIFAPGIDKPRKAPEGMRWEPVRALDPTKNPKTISGWELRPVVISPRGRGSYTADIDSAAIEARDDAKEAKRREVMGLPPEE